MKKALALVLALVLALSMAVSAFAELKDVVALVPTDAEEADLIPVVLTDLDTPVLHTYKGGKYFIAIEAPANVTYKDIAVTATGIASASIVEFDPEVYEIYDSDEVAVLTYSVKAYKGGLVEDTAANGLSYKEAVKAKEDLDKADKTTVYKVVCDQDITIIKLVVEDNYTVSYKLGELKVTAKAVDADKKVTNVGAKWTIINDVVIFNYEEVKSAALYNEDDVVLTLGSEGYSAYKTNGTYGTTEQDKGQVLKDAAVVPTTAFRAIEGKDITVDLGHNGEDYVTIKNVAAGQKGVNFSCSAAKLVDANGYTKAICDYYELEWKPDAITFEFYGDQVIKSEFEITFGCGGATWFDLREAFEIELEEDDIITYYVLKDGKVIDSITVDYMTVDYNEEIELVIKGANTTLGSYELRLDVPAAEVETETEANPNTGAESVVGVVAALAVVSLASAAAVSLKK